MRPGITVLLDDSVHLIRGKRIGLLTNQTGIDERGRSAIDLLTRDPRATRAGVRVVTLFSPEHGIRGTEDRENLASGIDERSGPTIHSLYGAATITLPDSTLRGLDALVFDLQDIGTRTWTYVGNLVYSLRAAERNGVRLIVLDRPAPITGTRREGPLLDGALANPEEPTPARPGLAYALYPMPLRHGMTMGEMARFYNDVVTDRDRLDVGRVAAAILWALGRTAGDSLSITPRAVDLRFGSAAGREALLRGDDPDEVIDRTLPSVVDFTRRARPYFIYR